MRLCPNPAKNASVPNPSIPVWADGMFAYIQNFLKETLSYWDRIHWSIKQLHSDSQKINIMGV
jgi:hypothetical protein